MKKNRIFASSNEQLTIEAFVTFHENKSVFAKI